MVKFLLACLACVVTADNTCDETTMLQGKKDLSDRRRPQPPPPTYTEEYSLRDPGAISYGRQSRCGHSSVIQSSNDYATAEDCALACFQFEGAMGVEPMGLEPRIRDTRPRCTHIQWSRRNDVRRGRTCSFCEGELSIGDTQGDVDLARGRFQNSRVFSIATDLQVSMVR